MPQYFRFSGAKLVIFHQPITIYFMSLDFFGWKIGVRAHTFYAGRDEFISTHSRFETWVCVAPESGRFRFEIETESGIERGQAQNGDLLFVRPRSLFHRHVIEAPFVYHVLQWSFWSEQGVEEGGWRPGKWTLRDTARLGATFAALRTLPGRHDARSARFRAHLLEELLHLCLAQNDAPPISDPQMRQAAELLTSRAGEVFSMSEISHALDLGSVQFTRRFRAATGSNPIEFLTRVRLQNAQKMLIETPATLDEIANRCGWASASYLIHVFERHLNTTPGRFRAMHRV